ncbi:MAG TPA: histidine kinase [Burkholderiaceae bacterium]|nr:histidine kinase [Burkholderiaceae bacterium]
MPIAPNAFDSDALAKRWHEFSALAVRWFHRYATWLVSLSWYRFAAYALLLIIVVGMVKDLPPLSWKYTETIVDTSGRRHPRAPAAHAVKPGPAQVAPPATPASMPTLPALATPPVPTATAASVASLHSTAPSVHVTQDTERNDAGGQKIDIDLPGIVIDTSKRGTIHKGNVDITLGANGIHIATAGEPGDAQQARDQAFEQAQRTREQAQGDAQRIREQAQEQAQRYREQGQQAREKALADAEKARAEGQAEAEKARDDARQQVERAKEQALRDIARDTGRPVPPPAPAGPAAMLVPAPAASAGSGSSNAVDMVVGGQHVHITLPAGASGEDISDAVDKARESIVDALSEAADQRKEEVEQAREDAKALADSKTVKATSAKDDESDADSDSDDDDASSDDGGRRTVRTHTVHYGDSLMPLTMWWVLGSLLLKITYKGRIQAEAKAAVATETAEAESLRRQVLEARMAMMQAQVEPHFLFNTLASIDHLIEFDPKRASQMQRNLISLLRASMPSMRASDSGVRPLDLELAVVRPYLEILKVRMEERLTTEIDVPEGLLSAEFPPMMIQTLVENSIKHGLEPKAEGGHLSVQAQIRHGNLCVIVADTGLGFEIAAKGTTHGTGVGLANIRERLALLYGAKSSLTIANNPGGGTLVTITVPYTTHSDEGASA